jgi:NADPH:quinone reductase-like Zn-dependent oxidoreductase
MKAAQISEYGDPSVITINDIAKPVVEDGKVLVEVVAASLNPFDTTVREGRAAKMIAALPVTLGGDIAGTVVEVGAGVDGFKAGDKVYGQAAAVAGNSGAFAEFAVTKANQLALAPANVDPTVAAALPLVGVSALQALQDHINLQSGQKILIHGGSGGIGSIAIQIAKHIGAVVATTVPAGEVAFARELGADEVIDYTSQDFQELIHDYDAVFDTAGGDVFAQSLSVLKRGGIAVSMIAHVDEAAASEHGVTALTQGTKVTTEALDKLRQLVEDGIITVRIDSVLPLERVQEAFRRRESGQAHGKVVLGIKAVSAT